MMFWQKKKTKAAPEQARIEFRSDDNMHQRAEKIWYALGFVNDRGDNIPKIAGWLHMYREWDNETEPGK